MWEFSSARFSAVAHAYTRRDPRTMAVLLYNAPAMKLRGSFWEEHGVYERIDLVEWIEEQIPLDPETKELIIAEGELEESPRATAAGGRFFLLVVLLFLVVHFALASANIASSYKIIFGLIFVVCIGPVILLIFTLYTISGLRRARTVLRARDGDSSEKERQKFRGRVHEVELQSEESVARQVPSAEQR